MRVRYFVVGLLLGDALSGQAEVPPGIEDARRYMLRPPAELGGPVSDLLDHLFELEEYTLGDPIRFVSAGKPWWGMARELFPVAGVVPTTSQPRWLLVARSEASREMIVHDAIVPAATQFLAPWCERIQLHLGQVIRIQPGQEAFSMRRALITSAKVVGM